MNKEDINIEDIKIDNTIINTAINMDDIINTVREKLKQKIEAARTIQRRVNRKYIKNQKIAKILCTNPPNILDKLQRQVTNKTLEYMYLFNCKLFKIEFSKFAKNIDNVNFINTKIEYCNFSGINFKSCKFYNLNKREKKYQAFFNSIRTTKNPIQTQDNISSLTHVKLDNCKFDQCYFYNIILKNIYISTNLEFTDCSFDNWCQIDLPIFEIDNDTNNIESADNNSIKIIEFIPDTLKPITQEDNYDIVFKLREQLKSPNIIFDNCKFKGIYLNSENTSLVHYKNCIFVDANFGQREINFVQFTNCSFQQCDFTHSKFVGTTIDNCDFINSTFNFTTFSINYRPTPNKVLTQFKNTRFNNCKFQQTLFHNWANPYYTCIIYPDCVFNNCIFINIICIGFKFNKYSLLSKTFPEYEETCKQTKLNMKNNRFHMCQFYGTNFDDCDLENCNFAIAGDFPNYFNWYGKMFLNNFDYGGMINNYGSDKTGAINSARFSNLFRDSIEIKNKKRHPTISNNNSLFYLKYAEYPPTILEKINRLTVPYDYFKYNFSNTFQILPATSFKNANIKTCNFQQAEGLESFDFSQVHDNDLNSVNFTFVDLTNAKFNGCNLIGTIFQIADIKGADFQDAIVNEHTDFENTQNTGLAENTDDINFGELQHNANETHAKSVYTINAKDELIYLFSLPTLDRYSEDISKLIYDFESGLTELIEDISNNTFQDSNHDTIKVLFIETMLNVLSNILEYNDHEKHKLEQDLKRCFEEEVIKILCSRKTTEDGKPWCWLELVMHSMIFLFNNTQTYIFIFLQTYFNEVFNAHGQGSKSCSLGMVERLVNIHSQASEIYISCFSKSKAEIDKLNIDDIQQFNPSDSSIKDKHITKTWIYEFNFPSNDVDFDVDFTNQPYKYTTLDTKYTYHKLINLLNNKADLPLKSVSGAGSSDVEDIIIDYDITPEIRGEWYDDIKIKVDNDEISTLDHVLDHYINFIIDYKYKQYNLTRDTIHTENNKKFDRYRIHLEEFERKPLEEAILLMCNDQINKETLTDYFSGGFSRSKSKKSRSKRSTSKKLTHKKLTGGLKLIEIKPKGKTPRSKRGSIPKKPILKLSLKRRLIRRLNRGSRRYSKPDSERSTSLKSSPLTPQTKKNLEITLLKAIFSIDKDTFLEYFKFEPDYNTFSKFSKNRVYIDQQQKDKISIISVPPSTHIKYQKNKYEIKQYWKTIYKKYQQVKSNYEYSINKLKETKPKPKPKPTSPEQTKPTSPTSPTSPNDIITIL